MKGMLYSSLLRNLKFIKGAGIYTLAATVAGAALILVVDKFREYLPTAAMLLAILPLISIVIALEGVDREMENSLKIRYANYTLSAVTPREFAVTELIKNLILTAYGMALSLFMAGIYHIVSAGLFKSVGSDAMINHIFAVIPLFSILCSLLVFGIMPLVIRFKSAEKAGLITGIIIGAFLIYPMKRVMDSSLSMQDVITALHLPLVPCMIAIFILLYALFYLLLEKRVERGNLC